MSESDVEYRGYFIDVRSFEPGDNHWRPKAVVSIYRNGALFREIMSAPGNELFDSDVAADTYALEMAKKWIDDNS